MWTRRLSKQSVERPFGLSLCARSNSRASTVVQNTNGRTNALLNYKGKSKA